MCQDGGPLPKAPGHVMCIDLIKEAIIMIRLHAIVARLPLFYTWTQ